MGGDSQGLFLRTQYHFDRGASLGVEADREWSGVHGNARGKKNWLGIDASYPVEGGLRLEAVAGLEDIDDPKSANFYSGYIFHAGISVSF